MSHHIDYAGDATKRLEEAFHELMKAIEALDPSMPHSNKSKFGPLWAINRAAVAQRKISNAIKALSNAERFKEDSE